MPDQITTGGRTIQGGKLVWWTGNDSAGDPRGIHPGVVGRFVSSGPAYSNYKLSICGQAASTYATTPIRDSTAADTTPGSMKLLFTPVHGFVIIDVDGSQPGWDAALAETVYRTHFEFGGIGTYVADTVSTATDTGGSASAKATYTFHVGPAADLAVRHEVASGSVAPGKTAFTIIAESEATPEIYEETYEDQDGHESANTATER